MRYYKKINFVAVVPPIVFGRMTWNLIPKASAHLSRYQMSLRSLLHNAIKIKFLQPTDLHNPKNK